MLPLPAVRIDGLRLRNASFVSQPRGWEQTYSEHRLPDVRMRPDCIESDAADVCPSCERDEEREKEGR